MIGWEPTCDASEERSARCITAFRVRRNALKRQSESATIAFWTGCRASQTTIWSLKTMFWIPQERRSPVSQPRMRGPKSLYGRLAAAGNPPGFHFGQRQLTDCSVKAHSSGRSDSSSRMNQSDSACFLQRESVGKHTPVETGSAKSPTAGTQLSPNRVNASQDPTPQRPSGRPSLRSRRVG